MKKLFLGLLLTLGAAITYAQPAYPFYQGSARMNGGAIIPIGSIGSYTLGYPNIFNGSGSNPCTTGDCVFTLSLASQNAGTFWGVDFSGSNAPSFINPGIADGEFLCRNGNNWDGCTAGGGGAPTDATYITQTADGSLSNEQALSALSTGIMRVATTTGVITSLTDSAGIAANISNETGSGSLVFATSPTLVTPILGTPTSGTLTNATGLPIATGVSGLGSGVATFLATPSTANFAAAVTGETGTGAVVFATSPTLVTPILGTPTSGTLTNATGLPISTGVSGLGTGVATFLGTPTTANFAAAVTGETGTGNVVFHTSPTLVTPILGTPTSATLTNATGLPISTGVSGLGTGVATFLATSPTLAGQTPIYDGSAITYQPPVGYGKVIHIEDDLMTTYGTGWGDITSCTTGNSTIPSAASDANHPFIWEINNSGTGCRGQFWGGGQFLTGGGEITVKLILRMENLSDATDEWDLFVGVGNANAANEPTDGVYFKYDRNTSTDWQIATANASTRTTQTATGTTATATGYHTYEVRINAAGTSASFYYDGVQTANSPIATNLPATSTRMNPIIKLQRSAGTATRKIWLDYASYLQVLTTPR